METNAFFFVWRILWSENEMEKIWILKQLKHSILICDETIISNSSIWNWTRMAFSISIATRSTLVKRTIYEYSVYSSFNEYNFVQYNLTVNA